MFCIEKPLPKLTTFIHNFTSLNHAPGPTWTVPPSEQLSSPLEVATYLKFPFSFKSCVSVYIDFRYSTRSFFSESLSPSAIKVS